jgi:uncharacterized protein YqjF (DUF2071 family)
MKSELISRRSDLSSAARRRMLAIPGEPFLFSHWRRAVFLHFETDAKILQREVPFELDLHEGRAYVSLVAFHLEKMRMRLDGKISEWLMKPVATHELLNIRVYVRHGNETGIYFLAEYLPNQISFRLGPPMYGLPYRLGKLNYHHEPERDEFFGEVRASGNILRYQIELEQPLDFQPSEAGTLDEFLLERYTAFTFRNGTSRAFRIWHSPWRQMAGQGKIVQSDLLLTSGEWFKHSRLVGAHYSPGFENVWMGRPRKIENRS